MSDTGDPLKKVKSGDPFRIPAATFNCFVDAARAHAEGRQQQLQTPAVQTPSSGIVLLRNDSGDDIDRYNVLAVSGVVFNPDTYPDSFKERVVLTGDTPATADAGRLVIALEPTPSGAIGRALASGVCSVKVNVSDADHTHADVNDGQAGSLASSETGAARILWKESGTGLKWAVVALWSPAAPDAALVSFPAKVTAALGDEKYTVIEQIIDGDGNFANKPGASGVTARNLAELSLGPGGAVPTGTIVQVTAMVDTGDPPTMRYIFDHPTYAKYLD